MFSIVNTNSTSSHSFPSSPLFELVLSRFLVSLDCLKPFIDSVSVVNSTKLAGISSLQLTDFLANIHSHSPWVVSTVPLTDTKRSLQTFSSVGHIATSQSPVDYTHLNHSATPRALGPKKCINVKAINEDEAPTACSLWVPQVELPVRSRDLLPTCDRGLATPSKSSAPFQVDLTVSKPGLTRYWNR